MPYSMHSVLELQTVEELHLALKARLDDYQILRFQSVFFPARSLYDEREVEYAFHGYDHFPQIKNLCLKAFSTRKRISRLRDKIENMLAPIFGINFFYGDVLSSEEVASVQSIPFVSKQGLIIPLYGPRGFVGMIGLAVDREDITDSEIRELHIICMAIFQRYCELKIAGTPKVQNLTDREIQILRHLMAGETNSEIAASVGISKHTVDGYIGRIFIKLQVSERVSAAMKARELGLYVTLDDLPDALNIAS